MWPPPDVKPLPGSIAYRYWRSCRTKVRFSTECLALSAKARMADGHDPLLVAYECQDCFGWHLGHAARREKG